MIYVKNEQIESIDLLTAEEAEVLPLWILCCGKWWWLATPGLNAARASGVNFTGSVRRYGHGVSDERDSVRPAAKIKGLPELEFGETVKVLGRLAIYVGGDRVLFAEPVFEGRFDGRSNRYEDSEIRERLAAWLDKELNG